jgi:endonuclease/exonuclease/phosphatase family metal-dependent hydrolase
VRFATWNIERLASRPKRERVLSCMAEIGADVWVLTESDDSLLPTGMQSLHCSNSDEERPAEERWVSIASRYPLEPLALTGDPIRSAAARVHPGDGDPFLVFGSVLPWTSDAWRGMRGSDGFAKALETQRGDLRGLRAQEPRSDFIWAGDFNQHLVDSGRYWSKRNKELIGLTLRELGLSPLTADPDPVTAVARDRYSVDHICVALEGRWDRSSLRVWPTSPAPDRRLSDHYGVAVDTLGAGS